MTSNEQSASRTPQPTALAERSTELLTAIRTGGSTPPLERELAGLNREALVALSSDRAAATTFWLNCYNAFAQLLLDRDRSLYNSRTRFFSRRLIPIAGDRFSLDEIEHGILRGGHWKLGGGYLRWPFYRDVVEQCALDPAARDRRIHFALNCGAASCPPIVAYSVDDLDRQLDTATRSYLDSEVSYDADRNVAQVPRLCLWFRGDFGGRRGIQQLLTEFEQVPPGASPGLRYGNYDWSLALGQFNE